MAKQMISWCSQWDSKVFMHSSLFNILLPLLPCNLLNWSWEMALQAFSGSFRVFLWKWAVFHLSSFQFSKERFLLISCTLTYELFMHLKIKTGIKCMRRTGLQIGGDLWWIGSDWITESAWDHLDREKGQKSFVKSREIFLQDSWNNWQTTTSGHFLNRLNKFLQIFLVSQTQYLCQATAEVCILRAHYLQSPTKIRRKGLLQAPECLTIWIEEIKMYSIMP